MPRRPSLALPLPLLVALLGCNALFGIEDATVRGGAGGGAGGSSGAAGSGGASAGAGGSAGQGGAGGGSAGKAGAGGVAPPLAQVAAGAEHTCAWLPGGTVQCWGAGSYGQLGNRIVEKSERPTTVLDAAGNALTGIARVELGNRHSCALDGEGGVLCWGENSSGQVGAPANMGGMAALPAPTRVNDAAGMPLRDVLQIAVGDAHACALLASGTVACWGRNDFGQLGSAGDQTHLARLVTDQATGDALADVRAIAAGDIFNCALTDQGKLLCWGSNNFGQLGATGVGSFSAGAQLFVDSTNAELDGIEELALGGFHGCARLAGGRVRCWGSDDASQLGGPLGAGGAGGDGAGGAPRASPGPHPDPVPVSNAAGGELTAALGLSLGTRHSCALFDGGFVRCWGQNASAELGDGTTVESIGARLVLRDEGGGEAAGAQALGLGNQHSCAAVDAEVYCWGSNLLGQLGRGENFGADTPTLFPQPVEGLSLGP
jgi:alpha-tubulin suppressor-like RCC1 family protein